MIFTTPASWGPVIPKYAAVPVFIIKNNLKTGVISRDRYFELLDQEDDKSQSISPTCRL